MLRFTWFLAYRCDKKIQGIKIYHVTTSLSLVIDEKSREKQLVSILKLAGTPTFLSIFSQVLGTRRKNVVSFFFLHVIFLPFFEKFSATFSNTFCDTYSVNSSFYITIFRVKNRKGVFFKLLFRSLRFVIRSKIAIS